MEKEILKLFNSVLITDKDKKASVSKDVLSKTISNGFILSNDIIGNYSNYDDIIENTKKVLDLTPEKMNNTFHKSWDKVENAPIMQLVLEQIMHYITTYGFEELGVYDDSTVYVPYEKLDIPELKENIKLTLIKGITMTELKEKVLDLLNSGIALKDDTMNDLVTICKILKLSSLEVDNTKNKEVKIRLYNDLRIVPNTPIEFLRYVIFKITGKTLLIKNSQTISEIKQGLPNLVIVDMFSLYLDNRYKYNELASIFNRYKPLFLAFKKDKRLVNKINYISKLSKTEHKSMPEDYLNTITSKNLSAFTLKDIEKFKFELDRVNIWRKIRLLYSLNYRTLGKENILYKIRNGKSFATKLNSKLDIDGVKYLIDMIKYSIIDDISKNVKDKKIYIPSYINYALPATEKQFTGNLPSGTSVSVKEDMIVGIHWGQEEGSRVDLDLSLINSSGKIGWDSSYREEDRSVLFSGDMTSAPKPNGATELFYIKQNVSKNYIIFANYFNYDSDCDCECTIIVGKEKPTNFGQNYMINPNNILCKAKTNINQKQKVLGLMLPYDNEMRFYFNESYLGKTITSNNSEYSNQTREYMIDYYSNMISLKEILIDAGAIIVEELSDDIDINLSPENLEKDTILKLLMD
ncbi:MAG: hypothetical protein EOM21_20520 [Gammaproteobacteria bacterium]|nr:hypothetical protein [Gammaproteobacteria bacterium]